MENFEGREDQPKHEYQLIQYVENDKKHGVPALISFFIPGLGQVIKGHIAKAFVFWLLLFGAVKLIIYAISGEAGENSQPLAILGLIALPVVFVWNVYDAYNAN